jgi:type III secretory pathway component EscR
MTTYSEIKTALENHKNTRLRGTQAQDMQEKFAASFDAFAAKLTEDQMVNYYEAMKQKVSWVNTVSDFAEFFGNEVFSRCK